MLFFFAMAVVVNYAPAMAEQLSPEKSESSAIARNRDKELAKIEERLSKIAVGLESKDPAIIKKAEAERKEAIKDLKAWAQRKQVDLSKELVKQPRKKIKKVSCPIVVTVDGKKCIFIGDESGTCDYFCLGK